MRGYFTTGMIAFGLTIGLTSLALSGQPVKLVSPITVTNPDGTSNYQPEEILTELRLVRQEIGNLQNLVFGDAPPSKGFLGRKPTEQILNALAQVTIKYDVARKHSAAALSMASEAASTLREQFRQTRLSLKDLSLNVLGEPTDSPKYIIWKITEAKRALREKREKSEKERKKRLADAKRAEKARLDASRKAELERIEAERKADAERNRLARIERKKRDEAERKRRLTEVEEKALASLREKHRNSIAVIIGNKSYKGRTPEVSFAHNDADAMKRFVLDRLGYRDGNIIDLRDASRNEIAEVFGNKDTHEGKLFDWVKPGKSDVVVFYSGHGVPGLKDKRPYLLPANGNANSAEITGFSIDVLYNNLAKTPARSITVYLDACFSGDSPKGMLVNASSGLSISAKLPQTRGRMTVITAAEGDQLASWDENAKLGLFTKHLLEALNGAADGKRFGNSDGQVSLKEVQNYLDDEMTYQARRIFSRRQKASVRGSGQTILASVIAAPIVGVRTTTAKTPTTEPALSIERMNATYVAIKTANLRSLPSTKSKIVGSVETGTSVNVTGRVKGKNWYRLDNDTFVYGSLIRSKIDLSLPSATVSLPAIVIKTPAKAAILIDQESGEVLFEKNADNPLSPASMSKLMTVFMVFERLKDGHLNLDDSFSVSEKAWRMGGSKMFVGKNTRIKIRDLLRGIIVQSGNDASVVVAEGMAGSEEAFAKEMTVRGLEIGLTNSTFKNATGWPVDDHLMSTRDLGILAMHLVRDFPNYYPIFSEKIFTYNKIRQGNRNPLLYRYEGADGLKTGHTEASGYGIVASAIRNGRRLIVVLRGLNSVKQRAKESERILNLAFRKIDDLKKPSIVNK